MTMQLKLKSLMVMSLLLAIVGCTSPAQQIMEPITYKKSVDFTSKQKLFIVWQPGESRATVSESEMPQNADLATALIHSAVDNFARKRRPGNYQYEYGKAKQVVFVQSLKSALEQQQVFSEVEIVSEQPKQLDVNQVAMHVVFTRTRVGRQDKDFPITLKVRMRLDEPNKSPYVREFIASSKPTGVDRKHYTFKQRQTEVSELLLDKMMRGLSSWHKQIA